MIFDYYPKSTIDYQKLMVKYHCDWEDYPPYDEKEPLWGPPFSIHLRHGICVRDCVMTQKGRLVTFEPPIYDEWTKTKIGQYMRSFKSTQIEHVPGTVVTFNTCFGDSYGHWISEILPCFAIARMLDLPDFKYYIDLGRTDNFFKADMLAWMGFELERLVQPEYYPCLSPCIICPNIIDANLHPIIQADNVVFIRKTRYSWWARDFVRNTFMDMATPIRNDRRIYCSRALESRRHILNEPDLLELLKRYDFEIFSDYYVHYSEQVQMFREAAIVITQRSSTFYNLWYCPENTKFIVLWQKDENKYPGIIDKLRDVTEMDCEPTPSADHPEDRNCDDITVDLDALEQSLARMLE